MTLRPVNHSVGQAVSLNVMTQRLSSHCQSIQTPDSLLYCASEVKCSDGEEQKIFNGLVKGTGC